MYIIYDTIDTENVFLHILLHSKGEELLITSLDSFVIILRKEKWVFYWILMTTKTKLENMNFPPSLLESNLSWKMQLLFLHKQSFMRPHVDPKAFNFTWM